jgi:hypothetical protein
VKQLFLMHTKLTICDWAFASKELLDKTGFVHRQVFDSSVDPFELMKKLFDGGMDVFLHRVSKVPFTRAMRKRGDDPYTGELLLFVDVPQGKFRQR